MGKRVSRTNRNNARVAEQALANLDLDSGFKPRGYAARHERANPNMAMSQKKIRPKTPNQAEFMDVIDGSTIAFGIGPAGTGKTFIAVRKALEMLAAKKVRKIVLSRPAKEAAGERLGFLPGDMEQKLHPHLMPIYDIIEEAMGPAALKAMMDSNVIEICPLAFMRGRTFNDAVIVLDEMQNATEEQFIMALTRIGERTTMIVTGDPRQSDLPSNQSGLVPTVEKLANAPGIQVTRFGKQDIVRSAIVSIVLDHLGE